MIEKITTNKSGNELIVKVVCKIRNFAVNPIKELTTEQVIDRISKEFIVEEILKVPKKRIGNTNRKKMSNFGTWIFKVKEEAHVEKPKNTKTTRSTKPKTTRSTKPKTTTTPDKPKTSIRNRMSKLANKKD